MKKKKSTETDAIQELTKQITKLTTSMNERLEAIEKLLKAGKF